MISVDKLLVSNFIKEDGDNRRLARQANIATMFNLMFSKHIGEVINAKVFRNMILENLKERGFSSEVFDINGDFRAHGDAYGKSGLNLDITKIGRDRYILFSLPNIIRCTRFLLGNGGRTTGSLYLKRLDLENEIIGRNDVKLEDLNDFELVDLLIEVPNKTGWEQNFANDIDKKFRNHITPGRKAKIIQIISERS